MFCLLIFLLVCCMCVHCAIFCSLATLSSFFSWELLDNPIACKNNNQTYHLLQQQTTKQTWSPLLSPNVPLPCNDCCIVLPSLLPLELYSSSVELLFNVFHPLHRRNNIVPNTSTWTIPPMLILRNSQPLRIRELSSKLTRTGLHCILPSDVRTLPQRSTNLLCHLTMNALVVVQFLMTGLKPPSHLLPWHHLLWRVSSRGRMPKHHAKQRVQVSETLYSTWDTLEVSLMFTTVQYVLR